MTLRGECDLIQAACDRSYVSQLLQVSSQIEATLRGVHIESASVLRYKTGKRCLIKYTGFCSQGVYREFLGKIRFKGLHHGSAQLQRELRLAGLNGNAGYAVPEVLGLVPELNMWLQEFVADSRQLSVDSADFVNAQLRAAQALVCLHRTPVQLNKTYTVDDEQCLLQSRLESLCQSRVELRREVNQLLRHVGALGQMLQSNTLQTTIHRDFYFDQVLLVGEATVLVDFDQGCRGSPELDVGNYVAHLREYAIRRPTWAMQCRAAEDVFVRTYFERMPECHKHAAELWAQLTLARHVHLSTILPGRAHTTQALLAAVLGQ